MNSTAPLYLIGGIGLVALVYVARCAWFPLGRCLRCRGEGRFRAWFGMSKHLRMCRRCKGTGTRVRPGRMMWDRLRAAQAKAGRAS